MDMKIRRAVPGEAKSLQLLARASKAYWGYSSDYMSRWASEAQVTETFGEAHVVFCAEMGGTLAGFYALSCEGHYGHLEHLWVAPPMIGHGVGRALLDHAMTQANASGASV